MSAWRVWRYLGMMQYDLRRLGATSLQWQDWCCCWMNSGMCWFKESTLPECIRFRWQSCDLFFAMGFFSSKVAPGFGKSQVVGEHWMRRGGERQVVQRGGTLVKGVDVSDIDIQKSRGHSWNYWEAKQRDTFVAIIWRASTHTPQRLHRILLSRGTHEITNDWCVCIDLMHLNPCCAVWKREFGWLTNSFMLHK